MKNIYKSEIFGEMMSLSDEDLASIDCKSMVIMQEVKRGRAIQEPRLIMTSTDGKQTIVDGVIVRRTTLAQIRSKVEEQLVK
jgi:hypothetical protein